MRLFNGHFHHCIRAGIRVGNGYSANGIWETLIYETKRAVKTASSEQVRRPIYASSVNLWRNYERHLDELIETPEPVLAELPATDQR
jgi:hypothetical protein